MQKYAFSGIDGLINFLKCAKVVNTKMQGASPQAELCDVNHGMKMHPKSSFNASYVMARPSSSKAKTSSEFTTQEMSKKW